MKQQLDTICQELIEYFGWKKEALNKLNRQEAFIAENVFLALENNNTLSAITQLYNLIQERRGYELSFSSFTHLTAPKDFLPSRIGYYKSYIDTIGKIVDLYDNCCADLSITPILSLPENREVVGDGLIENPVTASVLKEIIHQRFKMYRYKGEGKIERGDVYKIDPVIHVTNDFNRWIREKHITSNEHGLIKVSIVGKVSLLENTSSDFIFVFNKQGAIWIAFDSGVFQKNSVRKSVWESSSSGVDKKYDLPYKLLHKYFDKTPTHLHTANIDYLSLARQKVYSDTGFVEIHSSNHLKSEILSLITADITRLDKVTKWSIHVRGAIPIHGRGDFRIYIAKSGVVVGRWTSVDNTLLLFKRGNTMDDLMEIKLCNKPEKAALVMIIENTLSNSIDKDLLSAATAGEILSNRIGNNQIPPELNSDHFHNIEVGWGDFYQHNTLQFDVSYIGRTNEIEQYLDRQWFYYLLEKEERRFDRLSNLYTKLEHTSKKGLLENIRLKEQVVVERFYSGKNFSVVVDNTEVLCVVEVEDRGQLEIRKGTGVGRYREEEDSSCSCCNSSSSKCVKKAFIYDYRGLLYLLSTPHAKDLPEGYQTYMCELVAQNTAISYNTHPFSVLVGSDMCSIQNPKHIELRLYSCGRCHNRLSKEKQDLLINLEI